MTRFMAAGESQANANDVGSETVPEGYQRIGDVAREYGVTLRTLRFYEDKGLLSPRREGTTRLYDHKDLTRLRLILMGRRVGFSLREVKQMMDLYDPKGSNVRQLRVTLEKSEKQYARLEKQRAALDGAMSELSQALDTIREMLRARQQANAA
ncbi:MAG: MerR family DNA-binding transcriptional regulator [Rhizobiaceae bacterium]|nr:MerR family DNA-binding transcriptional regulator [Rhizobiaceae bacterium]MCV0405851.1 MerR family DNA-binding transcriptional regulator [Rhizobiaceae bacterium]